METNSEYKNRFLAALMEMESHKLKKQLCRPPLYRIFWLFGLQVRPPLYIPAAFLFFSYSIIVALLWAILLWIIQSRHDPLVHDGFTVTQMVLYSVSIGILIGGLISVQYNYYRRRYKLTRWEFLKIPE